MKRDPSGYWNDIGVKGDAPGHPFRGNQYSSGEGGGGAEMERDDSFRYNPTEASLTSGSPSRNGITETAVHEAIRTVLSDKRSYDTSLNYAVNYARAALSHPDTGKPMAGHELQVQVLYLLNNLSTWRHPDAAKVRETLRTFSKPEKKR